ncbi:MAG TPA: hypothetical protein PKJ75_01600 [Methanosarcina vacuolata]|nr:hypothetical protein [Methanosarcina vacuolata]HPS89982.1 hypothetical protein [Methanosarcina vacuolata]
MNISSSASGIFKKSKCTKEIKKHVRLRFIPDMLDSFSNSLFLRVIKKEKRKRNPRRKKEKEKRKRKRKKEKRKRKRNPKKKKGKETEILKCVRSFTLLFQ